MNSFLLVPQRFENTVPSSRGKWDLFLVLRLFFWKSLQARWKKWLLLHSLFPFISRTVTINKNYKNFSCPCCTLLLFNTTSKTIQHYVFCLMLLFKKVIWKHPHIMGYGIGTGVGVYIFVLNHKSLSLLLQKPWAE